MKDLQRFGSESVDMLLRQPLRINIREVYKFAGLFQHNDIISTESYWKWTST